MFVRSACCVILVIVGLREANVFAAEVVSPRIPGFERFYAEPTQKPKDDEDDEEPIKLSPETGGRILLSELNCTACHAIDEQTLKQLSPKQAPILDGIGSRVKVEWLRSYLANPHAIKPGTTMPDLIETIPQTERAASVEALTHFLASTGVVTSTNPNATAARKGANLFRTVGCLACHNAQGDDAPQLTTSVPLPDLGKKYTASSLMAFLKDPLKSRPSGRMPALNLSDEDTMSIAHHFVQDGNLTPTTKYQLFHGGWDKLPDFPSLKAVGEGICSGFDLSVAGRPNEYGLRFTSFLNILKEGEYEFWLGSDDGSRLIIDDTVVADCDGVHPHQTVQGRKQLGVGFHEVVVEYFQGGGEATLEVQIAGQGLAQQPLGGFLSLEAKPKAPSTEQPPFTLDPELAKKGRELFATIGCASCHAMTVDGQRIKSRLAAKPLNEVRVNTGCLTERVTGNAPRYGLNSAQRQALELALKTPFTESAAETTHRTLTTLNCYACHQRNRLGGVEIARDGAFDSRQREMGDEGRLPPTLTGVGDKLRTDWLRHVLHHSSNDRKEYMVTRMPRFGPANVEPLVDQFVNADRPPETLPKADFPEPEYRVKAHGRHMVGGQALSCIKCHDFGPYPSTGVRAISLTTMHKRLRPDWFYRYVLDPQAYRRGTRMPAPWPFGQTTIRNVLNADVNLQVQAVWLYLSDAEKAAVPVGLVREPIELKPTTEPIIYRNFIQGAGSRAIGVGYPEGVNLAFDANEMSLAMIWHGAFIDASRHWTGRGQGFESPLGDDVLPLPSSVSLAILDATDEPFPQTTGRDQGYKFLGYRLDAQKRPVFRYSLHGLTVTDHPVPVLRTGKYATLNRSIHFEGNGSSPKLWLRAATGNQINVQKPGQFQIDGTWTIEVEEQPAVEPQIRESKGQQELLIPVQLKDGKAQIKLHYVW